MPERDGYIPGVPCWVDTSQPDPEAAVAFYGALFGWDFENVTPPGSGGDYFIARIRAGDVAAVSPVTEGAPPVAMWNTYIWVQSADEAASKVIEAGGKALMEPFDVGDAGRMAAFADSVGASFCVWQARSHKGARIVNEADSLNFNGLHVHDVAAAKKFYHAVFGWRTITVADGAEMWTMPGYGDHLERDNPGLRERMAAMGAPSGFEDVVATIAPIPEDEPNVAAYWDVTFAVDDADELADKAAELGGRVIVAPRDVPWARMTVIADPQGATLNATKFVPENKDLASRGQSTVTAA